MSLNNIRTPLEIALHAITPKLPTQWENTAYAREQGTDGVMKPWQEVRFLLNEPDNSTLYDGYHQERGVMQVALHYPAYAGAHPAAERAELIRGVFRRGATFTNGGVTTQIEATPRVGAGMVDSVEQEYVLPVYIRFKTDVFA